MKKVNYYKETQKMRKERVQCVGNRYHTRVVESPKKKYNRQEFKKKLD